MKVWPIITLGALLYGGMYADGMNTQRESNPHPRSHHTNQLDAEVADAMKAFDHPVVHRPVTMAFREVFAKLLNDETDWSAPESKATAQAEADADDGQDPGKKLFWSTNHPDVTGVPFTGWGDPNAEPDHPLVSPPACSTCRPDLEIFYYIIEDPAPPKEDENFAVEAQNHITMGNLPFGELQALVNMVITPSGEVTIEPCVTILVNGVCPIPCTPTTASLPSCATDPVGVPTDPLGGLPTGLTDPPPIIAGGGSGSGSGVGSGVSVGGVPEPSTWAMGVVGFIMLGVVGYRRGRRDSRLLPRDIRAGAVAYTLARDS